MAISSDAKCIKDLTALSLFRELNQIGKTATETRQLNFFSLADRTISENAWSRTFAWLLSSADSHNLGLTPALTWLNSLIPPKVSPGPLANFADAILTTTEVPTLKGRRIDVLVRVLDSASRIRAVIVASKTKYGAKSRKIRSVTTRRICPSVIPRRISLSC